MMNNLDKCYFMGFCSCLISVCDWRMWGNSFFCLYSPLAYGFTASSDSFWALTQYWIYNLPQIQSAERCCSSAFMISGFIGDVVGQYHFMILPEEIWSFLKYWWISLPWFPLGLRDGLGRCGSGGQSSSWKKTCCNLHWFDFFTAS